MNLGISGGGKEEVTWAGVDLRVMHESGLRLQAEFMDRTGDDDPAILAAKDIAAKARGWYVQVSWQLFTDAHKFVHYIKPVIQVDGIDLNRNTATNSDRVTTAIGLVYAPQPHVYVKFEYDFVTERHGKSIDNDTLWLSTVWEF